MLRSYQGSFVGGSCPRFDSHAHLRICLLFRAGTPPLSKHRLKPLVSRFESGFLRTWCHAVVSYWRSLGRGRLSTTMGGMAFLFHIPFMSMCSFLYYRSIYRMFVHPCLQKVSDPRSNRGLPTSQEPRPNAIQKTRLLRVVKRTHGLLAKSPDAVARKLSRKQISEVSPSIHRSCSSANFFLLSNHVFTHPSTDPAD